MSSANLYIPVIERMPSVIKRTGLSKKTIYRLIAASKFPASVPLTDGRSRGFDQRAVSAWIEARCMGIAV